VAWQRSEVRGVLVERFRKRMLRVHGLGSEDVATLLNLSVSMNLSGVRGGGADRRRQWVLIMGSIIGVVLLAVDAITASAGQ